MQYGFRPAIGARCQLKDGSVAAATVLGTGIRRTVQISRRVQGDACPRSKAVHLITGKAVKLLLGPWSIASGCELENRAAEVGSAAISRPIDVAGFVQNNTAE